MEPVDSAAAIRGAVAATSSLTADRGIEVAVELAPDLPPVYADRDRLTQVIVNLTANAVKFAGGPDARIVIAAAADGDSLVVSVTDNGPGVPEKARETVFEKFRQVSASPARKPSGTGLGLPICRQIVEHFGGRIWVDSAYRDGARFCFSLPRYRGGAGEATAAE